MYISDQETLGQEVGPAALAFIGLGDNLSSLGQCPGRSQSAFTSAEHQITEQDAPEIFKILGGPSPWQGFLQANLAAGFKHLPQRPIRILIDLAQRYLAVYGGPLPPNAQGFVDRRNATIYLTEFPKGRAGLSMVGLALHEAVHLFSHPPGKSNRLRATVYDFLGEGLLEGLTQVVTEDILACQGIRPMRASLQAYAAYTPVARRFVDIFSRALVGDAYFNGRINNLLSAIHGRWTQGSYNRVRALTTQEKTQAALQLIDSLEQAYRSRARVYGPYRWEFRGR
jgi:hypothetical protein